MRRDDSYLADMLVAARKALAFAQGLDSEAFLASDLVQHAVLRSIQIVGEAARQMSLEFKAAHPQIPWSEIVGMRHHLVHAYSEVDLDLVWQVLERDLPELIRRLEPLVNPGEHA